MNESTVFVYESAIGKIIFKYDSAFWISEIDGVSSVDVAVSASSGAYQIGTTITEQSVQPKTFTVDGYIFDPVKTNRARLLEVVAPQVPATFTMIDGAESWYLDVVPEKTPDIAPGNGIQEFQFQLYAAYPYWRTTKEESSQVAGLTPMFQFPFFTGGEWYISKYSENYYTTINNTGNVPIEVQVIFTARAELKNPEIYHTGTGKRIRINKTMTAGERIVVSTIYGKKGVTAYSASGVAENGFKYLDLSSDLSFALVPGENLLRTDASANRAVLSARVVGSKGVKSGV